VYKDDILRYTILCYVWKARSKAFALNSGNDAGMQPKLLFSCIIANDDQQDANTLVYIFIPNKFYMFQAMSSPIIRSTCLYLQLLILSTYVVC